MIRIGDDDRIGSTGASCEVRGCRNTALRRVTIYRPHPDWVDICAECLDVPEIRALLTPPRPTAVPDLEQLSGPVRRPSPPTQPVLRLVPSVAPPQENPMPGPKQKPLPAPRHRTSPLQCGVSGCVITPSIRGLCKAHYDRLTKERRLDGYALPSRTTGARRAVLEPVPQVAAEVVSPVRLPSPAAEMLDLDPLPLGPAGDPVGRTVERLVEGAPPTEMGASALDDGLGRRIAGGQLRVRVPLEDASQELLRLETATRRRVQALHQLRLLPRVDGIEEIRITLIGDGWSDAATLGAEPAEMSLPLVYRAVRSALQASVMEVRRQLIDQAFPGQWIEDDSVNTPAMVEGPCPANE